MNFKEKYPVLADYIYLDTASSGLISIDTLAWRRKHDELFFNKGSYFRENEAAFLSDVRNTISNYFNAPRDLCFLVPNFSFGFSTFLRGLDQNSKFLLLAGDYPSVNYAVNLHGVKSETLEINSNLEAEIFKKIEEYNPDVFACSLVQYIDGYRINLNLFKLLKMQFPNLIIAVDGTQYCGTETFDFQNSGIDFIGASGYKWMLAGYGNGFVLLKDSAAKRIYQKAKDKPKAKESFRKGKTTLSTFFEPGHLDTLAFGSLRQAILERKEIGEDYIKSKIVELGQRASVEFEKRKILTAPFKKSSTEQYIFNLNLKLDTLQTLLKERVTFTKRGAGIRIAFNFYNNMDDLNRILTIIDETS